MKPAITGITIATIAATSLAAAPAATPAPANGPKKPNVLVIMVDQLAAWTLGCYGGNEIGTPNIDTLAREGSLVTGFIPTVPLCSPSRASFMTGLFPGNNDVVTNNIQIRQNVSTWAQVLRDAGYQTGYAGKWHLDGSPERPGWVLHGKDMGWTDHRYMYCFGHYKTIDQLPGDPYPRMTPAISPTPEHYPTDWFTSRAIEFMDKNKNGNFCYMLSIPDPHVPYSVRAPYNTMFPPATMKIPATLAAKPTSDHYFFNVSRLGLAGNDDNDENEGDGVKVAKKGKGKDKGKTSKPKNAADQVAKSLPKNKSQYFGMIKCIDENVGRIIKYLKANNLYDNTIIVFTSDHGDLMGDHALMGKGYPFDGCARVPFIIRYPAKIKAGTVCDNVVSSVDFYPALLSLAGVEQKVKVDGKNMAVLFTGAPEAASWENKAFFRHDSRAYPWVGVVTKDYKLVYGKTDLHQKAWLIDRKKDPTESTNQIDNPALAGVIKTLGKDVLGYCKTYNDPFYSWMQKRVDN